MTLPAPQAPRLLFDGPASSRLTLVLAHGAGAGMDTPFLERIAGGVAAAGVRVARFEFPYVEEQRRTGRRRPPDREPVLRSAWHRVIAGFIGSFEVASRLVIGGKSMGGRMASLVADEAGVAGLVCLGYPFHPPGRPERLRTEHLRTLTTPALFLQGTRDPFGSRAEVEGYELSPAIELVWLEDGDHSFRPRVRSGHDLEGHLADAVEAIVRWLGARGRP